MTDLFSRRTIFVIGGAFTLLVISWAIAYEPVTRNLISQDSLCNNCHLAWEFNPDARLTVTRAHASEAQPIESQASCVDCHLPEGWWNATYAYTHFLSITDLFGHFRDLETERSGEWMPPRAATAYRVRDRMFEYDSVTCRACHVEGEIELNSKRGVNAHKLALDENTTCIECHNNLVHREVGLRKGAFNKTQPPAD